MKQYLICSFFLLIILPASFAQTYTLTGKVLDAKDNSTIIGASVIIAPATDTTAKTGTITDTSGNFTLSNVTAGQYVVWVEYIGYRSFKRNVTISKDLSLGIISLNSKGNILNTVTINGKQVTSEQKGDTSQFNADAFKTHPDATAEDLVTKMPGVTSDNSGVKVNGEAVQQVYVDGKPFFGTDPTLALKNLPAEVIDKIQVFDKLSDQSQFTGFDDGNSQKTMNIITRKNKSNGFFGKAYAGYGTDDRYLEGGSLNYFNNDTRISLIGLFNNVNQQNFSSQDILGITGGSGQNYGGGGSGRGSGTGGRGGTSGGGGGGSSNNFLVGSQNGIATTNSIGLNYSDKWGKKIKVSGSYFYNSTDNINSTQLVRNYFTTNDTSLVYNENDQSETKNKNHRFNLRLEYTIDSNNSIIFTPSLSLQENYATTSSIGLQTQGDVVSANDSNYSTVNTTGYNYSGNLLYQHKFHKKGRTISINVNTAANNKTGDGSYYSHSHFTTSDTTLDQQYTLTNSSYSVSTNVTYTEPVGKKGQVSVSYNPSYTNNTADKENYNFNNTTQKFDVRDTSLSNKYNNDYTTQRGGLSYRISDKKMSFMVGANLQYASLYGDEYFPRHLIIDRPFTDVLPTAMFNYRYADGKNLRIIYRTNTQAPGITQLQNVIDISNPLLLKSGNPNLRQDYEQTLIMRYGSTKSTKSHNLFAFLYANYINNYIGNATYIPLRDSQFQQYPLSKGSQLTMPVNLNGYFSGRLFITYSMPLSFIKSNLNLLTGFNYTRTPGLINNVTNISDNYTPTAGIVISSNISEKIDFTISYTGNYNVVENTLQTQSNNNYFSHVASVKFNWIFLNNFVFNTNVTESYYEGFSNAPSENITLWNAYVGYKFLKKQALEARLSVFDILSQNKNINRTVTETYVEDSRTQILQQYFMFTLTYTIRKFKGVEPPKENVQPDDRERIKGMFFPNGK